MRVLRSQVLVFLGLCSFASISSAVPTFLDANREFGAERAVYTSPYGYSEVCVIPKLIAGIEVDEKSQAKQKDLCKINFYDVAPESKMAMCPKIFSTSPAIEIFNFAKSGLDTRVDFEAKYCAMARHKPAKKIAKFKQSITCSYTPSILAYYQLSQYFGGILHIPEAVIRTMDKRSHFEVVQKAIPIAEKNLKPTDIVRIAWTNYWPKAHQNAANNPQLSSPGSLVTPWLFTSDYMGVYGALSENPSDEYGYGEVYGKFTYDQRYQIMMKQKPFQLVSNGELATKFLQASLEMSAQSLRQMRDMSEMILLDTLLNQQDRVGNIAYIPYAYYLKDDKLLKIKLAEAKIDTKVATAILGEGGHFGTIVKEMQLKDNDCGVAKSNKAREFSLLEEVRHIRLKTYQKLLALRDEVQKPETKAYFKAELLFNDEDYDGPKKFKGNVEFAAALLQKNCREGKLFFDIDIETHVAGKTPSSFTDQCELTK